MTRLLLIMFCGLVFPQVAGAVAEEGRASPMVQVDVIVEMDAINESLRSTSHSIQQISESIQLMAESGELDPDQQQKLSRILDNLDQVMRTTSDSVNALPSLVQRLRTAIVAQSSEILSDVKFWSIIIISGLFILVIAIGVGLYVLVLRPLQQNILSTIDNVAKIAQALEDTSRALETNNTIQQELLKLGEARSR
ncbi:MAG: hypothetical protein PVJ33_15030 [Lysobacterales bacterium]